MTFGLNEVFLLQNGTNFAAIGEHNVETFKVISSVKISDELGSELLKWLPAALQDSLIKGDYLDKPDVYHDLWRFLDICENIIKNNIVQANYLIDAAVGQSQYQEELTQLKAYTQMLLRQRPNVSEGAVLGLTGVCFCTSIKDRLWQIKQTLPSNLRNLENTDHRIAIADYGSNDGLEGWLTSSGIIESPNLIYQKFDIGEFSWSSPVAKNLASSLAPDGYGIFNLDADNFVTINDVEKIFNFLNNDQVVHQFSGKWGDGSFGRIGLPPQRFAELSGYEERFLPMGYQDADLLTRATKQGLGLINLGAPVKEAIQNDAETKFAFCGKINGDKMNEVNRLISECLMASGSLEASNQISKTIMKLNRQSSC